MGPDLSLFMVMCTQQRHASLATILWPYKRYKRASPVESYGNNARMLAYQLHKGALSKAILINLDKQGSGPGGIRTLGPSVKSRLLYLAELRAPCKPVKYGRYT